MWRKPYIWMAAIVVIGFIARLVAYGFVKVPWILYDEVIYIDTARQILRGSLLSVITRDQIYPPGWSFVLAAIGGFIQDPFVQYKVFLIFTMFLSSLVPVFSYQLTKNWKVSVISSFLPALFVYSSNIMSETFYTLSLFVFTIFLRAIVRDDLVKKWHIILAALLMSFFVYALKLVRSFGIVILPSYILAVCVFLFITRTHVLPKKIKSGLAIFSFLMIVFYLMWQFLGSAFIFTKGGLYETNSYYKALSAGLKNIPLLLTLIKNETVVTLVSTLWVLPLFFVIKTIESFHHRKYEESVVRLFLFFLLIISTGLTIVHMLQTVHRDPQYLLFARYVDPVFVLLFVYSAADFFTFIKEKTRLPGKLTLVYGAVVLFFVWYLKNGFYEGQYKFGNNMAIYFLSIFYETSYAYPLFILALFTFVFFLYRRMYKHLLWVSLILFSLYSFVAISKTIAVPKYVHSQYLPVVDRWIVGADKNALDKRICIYDGYVTVIVYYQYHFLYPYRYLKNCSEQKNTPVHHLIVGQSKDKKVTVPAQCRAELQFNTGEVLYYCPQGVNL